MSRYTPFTWADDPSGGTPITAARLQAIEDGIDLDIPIADIDATGTADDTTFLRGDGEWATPSGGGGASALDDLTDVDVTTVAPTDGQSLVFDTADNLWKPATVSGGGGGGALDDLTDVDTTGQTSGQFLGYDGTQWEPTSLPAASDTAPGIQENSTDAEGITGTATNRTMTPATTAAAIAAMRGAYVGINAQTGTTYTPVLGDQGKLVTLTNAASITVTLPQNSDLAFPVGASIDFLVKGAGQASFVAGTGATKLPTGTLTSRQTGAFVTVVKIDTNEWAIAGDLA